MQVLKENFIDRRRLGWRLFWSVLSVFSLAIAQAQNNREQEIAQAREKYYQGEFDAAIDMLNRCIRQNDLTEAQKMQAHKPLAQAHFAVEQIVFSSATTMFAKDDIAETTPALPNNFTQAQATITTWSESAAPASKLNLKLWVDRLDGAVYQKGEKMTAYVRAGKDCYLYLFYHDGGGNDFLIFPNRLRPNNHIARDRVYEIPNRVDQFDFTIVPPFGVEILKAFASTQPLPELKGKEIAGGIKQLKLSAAELAKTLRGVAMTAREVERAEASCVVTTVER